MATTTTIDANEPTRATIYRMVTPEHVCPFGIKAKALLRRAGYQLRDEILESRAETDAFQAEHDVDTTPQIFVDGRRIGGYEALLSYLGMEADGDDETTYQPIIAVFAMTALMAAGTLWASAQSLIGVRSLELFVAYSMCVLAVLKLRDLSSFSDRFVTYDILARRRPLYGNVYPFAEGFVGLGMIAGLPALVVGPPALFIGTVGAISVIKAVYVEKRELHCACVGGSSEVPLGAISLTENLMMVAMGAWMFVRPLVL